MDVFNAVSYLKCNESDGFIGLSSDYLINACNELFVHISCLFPGLIIHGAVTDDMTVSTLVPIPKGKNTSCTDSSNYRAIALSFVLGKVFDRIVLSRYHDALVSSGFQFGFKQKHSTAMCTFVLREAIKYYNHNRGTVLVDK